MSPAVDVLQFYLLTLAISWGLWLPVVWTQPIAPVRTTLLVAGTFGPAAAASIQAGRRLGPGGPRRFLRFVTRWRLAPRWWLIGIAGPPAVVLVAVMVSRLVASPILEWQDPASWYLVLPVFVYVAVLGGPLGEELGWRGYALSRLQSSHHPTVSALLVGLAWAVWHAPLFAVDGTVQASIPELAFIVQILATSIIYAWLWNRTGSLPLVVAFHATFNTAVGVFPILPESAAGSVLPLWTGIGMAATIAIGLVLRTGGSLGRTPAEPNPPVNTSVVVR